MKSGKTQSGKQKSNKQKSDNQQQAKQDLLHELEDLRAQLIDPESELTEEEIPLLLDKVEHAIAQPEDTQADKPPEELAPGSSKVLPGQQSLFEKTSASDGVAEPMRPARPTARGDNPFLPRHIRDRLDERRRALADDIAQATDSYRRSMEERELPAPPSPPSRQTLVDELVAEYLPRIEAELRFRLAQKLEQNSNPDPNEDDSD